MEKERLNIVYQIKAVDFVAYVRNIADCDSLCRKMIDKGIYSKVRRMKRTEIPMCDISLVINL